jgi:hypothetical protein
MGIHQVASSLKLLPTQIWTISKHLPDPLLVDGIGPFGAVKICNRNMHQQVAQWSGIEYAGVI